MAADTADEVVARRRAGPVLDDRPGQVLAGASTGVRADIGDTEEGLRGGAARKGRREDVSVDLSLVHRAAGRAEQFEAMKARLKPMLANQQARPEDGVRDALASALTQDHPRARPLTPASSIR